jgi:hypothetical protein
MAFSTFNSFVGMVNKPSIIPIITILPTIWYKFNAGDISGQTIYDYATRAYDGTVVNGSASSISTTTFLTGNTDSTGSFNYTGGSHPKFQSFTPSASGCTFSCWVKFSSPPTSFLQIFQFVSSGFPNSVLSIQFANSTDASLFIGNSTVNNTYNNIPFQISITNLTTWYHFAVVLTNSAYLVYFNDVIVLNYTPALNEYNSYILGITRTNNVLGTTQQNGQSYGNAFFDDFRVYNTALSRSNISALYNQTALY